MDLQTITKFIKLHCLNQGFLDVKYFYNFSCRKDNKMENKDIKISFCSKNSTMDWFRYWLERILEKKEIST